jgi:uncharacterized protein
MTLAELNRAYPYSKEGLIQQLKLERHDEGGYFRQIYQSEWMTDTPDRPGGRRYGINTIYYMLTDDSPIGHFHRNRSEIIHFFHVGSPMTYLLLTPEGQLSCVTLGPDPAQGQVFQMTVPGNVWKASFLVQGTYGLLSEAVAPGFDYRDRELATPGLFQDLFPQLWPELAPYTLAHTNDHQ